MRGRGRLRPVMDSFHSSCLKKLGLRPVRERRQGRLLMMPTPEGCGALLAPMTDFWMAFHENPGGLQPPTIVLKSVLSKYGSYVGRNAFGVTIVVKTSTTIEHGIVVSLSSAAMGLVKTEESPREYRFSFPLDISQARILKPFLRELVVGHLIEARVYKGSDTIGAGTLDMPYKDKYEGVFVPFSIDDIRILDIRSGKVVATLGPE